MGVTRTGVLRLCNGRHSGRLQTFPEVDRVDWFAPVEARRRIIERQVAFVDELERPVAGSVAK